MPGMPSSSPLHLAFRLCCRFAIHDGLQHLSPPLAVLRQTGSGLFPPMPSGQVAIKTEPALLLVIVMALSAGACMPLAQQCSCSAIYSCALEGASLRTCWRHRRLCRHCVMHMTCCWSASTVRLIPHEHDIKIVFYQAWLHQWPAIQQSQRAPPPPQQPAARPSRARNLTYCRVSLAGRAFCQR